MFTLAAVIVACLGFLFEWFVFGMQTHVNYMLALTWNRIKTILSFNSVRIATVFRNLRQLLEAQN